MQHEVNAYTEDPQEKFLKKLRKFNLTGDRATGRPGARDLCTSFRMFMLIMCKWLLIDPFSTEPILCDVFQQRRWS